MEPPVLGSSVKCRIWHKPSGSKPIWIDRMPEWMKIPSQDEAFVFWLSWRVQRRFHLFEDWKWAVKSGRLNIFRKRLKGGEGMPSFFGPGFFINDSSLFFIPGMTGNTYPRSIREQSCDVSFGTLRETVQNSIPVLLLLSNACLASSLRRTHIIASYG